MYKARLGIPTVLEGTVRVRVHRNSYSEQCTGRLQTMMTGDPLPSAESRVGESLRPRLRGREVRGPRSEIRVLPCRTRTGGTQGRKGAKQESRRAAPPMCGLLHWYVYVRDIEVKNVGTR